MNKPSYSIAVVGATGLVGTGIIEALAERQFPVGNLRVYASLRTAGEEVRCGDVRTHVELLDSARFDDTDLVFFAAGEQVSAEWAERAAASGAVIIDTSQLFADDPSIPLIVPEVNPEDIAGFADRRRIVSPDWPVIALAVTLKPVHAAAGLGSVVATALEPVSGAGRAGIQELQRQTVDLMNARSVDNELFPRRIAFNVLPHVGAFLAGGMSRDEEQTAKALRRLLDDAALSVSITRVRMPLFFGGALAVHVESLEKLTAAAARDLLCTAPGILVQDDIAAALYPTPAETVGMDATCVGRIREDESANLLDLWVTIDNIRKGSAVNAVQIAELLIRDYL
jgi:aspartate-semialdehyde dehydrogenase